MHPLFECGNNGQNCECYTQDFTIFHMLISTINFLQVFNVPAETTDSGRPFEILITVNFVLVVMFKQCNISLFHWPVMSLNDSLLCLHLCHMAYEALSLKLA